jgi:hypothetical protein
MVNQENAGMALLAEVAMRQFGLLRQTPRKLPLFSGLLAPVFVAVWAGGLQAQVASDSVLTAQCQEGVRHHFNAPSMVRFTSERSNAPGDGTIAIRGRVEGMTGSGNRQYDYECRMLRRDGTWVADQVTLTPSERPETEPAERSDSQ